MLNCDVQPCDCFIEDFITKNIYTYIYLYVAFGQRLITFLGVENQVCKNEVAILAKLFTNSNIFKVCFVLVKRLGDSH